MQGWVGGFSRFPAKAASRTLLLFSAGLGSRLTWAVSRHRRKPRLGGCHLQPPFSPGSSRQPRSGHAPQPVTPSGVPHIRVSSSCSAAFAGRPGGRRNTDHDFDTDRVGPSSGQPGNITPRGPSPPRTRNLFRFLVRTRTTGSQTSEGTRWGPVAPCVEPAWSLCAVPVHRPLWRQLHQRQLLPLLQQL